MEKMVWLGKSANVHWWNQWVPVYTGKYRVWHMFTAVTHFSIHLDLISSLSSSYGRDPGSDISLYLDWLWNLAAAAQSFIHNQRAGRVPCEMSCSLHTILLRRCTSCGAEGCFFKAAHGFSDSSGWFTFHIDWTGGGGADRRKCTIV